MPDFPTDPHQTAADAALALELVTRFFGSQIDAGAVLREEIAQHMRACALAVAERQPAMADYLGHRTEALIATLPSGWAEGSDDWVEPA